MDEFLNYYKQNKQHDQKKPKKKKNQLVSHPPLRGRQTNFSSLDPPQFVPQRNFQHSAPPPQFQRVQQPMYYPPQHQHQYPSPVPNFGLPPTQNRVFQQQMHRQPEQNPQIPVEKFVHDSLQMAHNKLEKMIESEGRTHLIDWSREKLPEWIFQDQPTFEQPEAKKVRYEEPRYTPPQPIHHQVIQTTRPFKYRPVIREYHEEDEVLTSIVGKSKDLEKIYLRITGEIDPNKVRPEEVLRESFEYVIEKYMEKQDYEYLCEQLKSIRQDLTVQRIKNSFTILVYETHARLSLKHRDLSEYNQCQTQLMQLFDDGLDGNIFEFICYQILYMVFTAEILELRKFLIKIGPETRKHEYIQYALRVLEAHQDGNYSLLFTKLYKSGPKKCKEMFDIFIDKLRVQFLKTITKSLRPVVPFEYLQRNLGFEREEMMAFFLKHKCVFSKDHAMNLDCKETFQNL